MKKCKIILADDHPIIRSGITLMIEKKDNCRVIGEADDGLQLLKMLRKLTPDIVIIDLHMPKMVGIEAIWEINRLYPTVKTIVLSAYLDKTNTRRAFSAGASAVVSKASLQTELVRAIETVGKGELYFSPDVVDYDIERLFDEDEPDNVLTHREIQIVTLIAEGHTSKIIGELMGISSRTVDKHRANVMKKLKCSSIVDVIRHAISRGYILP